MSEARSRRRIRTALGVLALLGWVAVDLVPPWLGSPRRMDDGQRRLSSRLGYEQRYNAGWLTAYFREHGQLPQALPPNRAAAGNAALVELCPQRREDLISDQADWALCREDRAVRALARRLDLVIGVEAPQKVELFPQ